MTNKSIKKANQKNISLYIPEDIVIKESQNSFLKNLVITQIGYLGNAYHHFIRRKGIHEYILLYCIDGKGWIETGGNKILVGKGDLAFCDINRPHAYGADSINPWSIHWAHFIGVGVPELFKILNISEQASVLQIGEKPELIVLMNEAYKALANGYSFPNLFYASTCFQEFFSFIIKLQMHSGMENSNEIDINNIINFMLKNINTVFSLEEFAAYMKISKYHFARRFKEKTGYSPIEYFNRLKIQKACELLVTSTLEIKEISGFLAFNNPFYFSEVFKKIIGYSPRKYRDLQRAIPL
jgi:AraC family transcriptional regulator, arabinose operon regulatory protein